MMHFKTLAINVIIGAALTAACVPSGTGGSDGTSGTTTTTMPDMSETALCQERRTAAANNPPLFDRGTTWNLPASCLGTRADSARWSKNWFESATYPGRADPTKRGAIDVSFDEYSSPVYDAAEATGMTPVFITGWGPGDNLGAERSIPWNAAWTPAAGNDLEMIIIDRSTGREWALWGVQKTNWSSCLTLPNLLGGYRPGVDICAAQATVGRDPDGSLTDVRTASGWSDGWGRGMGAIHAMALLPTLDEIERGSVNHAVNMETYGTMFGPACTRDQMATADAGRTCGFAVAPATRLEWFTGPATCGPVSQPATVETRSVTVPEGMRFALRLTDAEIDAWLDRRGYRGATRNTARIFAVALRDYGWIVSDTSCWGTGISVEGVANPTAAARWQALGIDNFGPTGDTLLDGLVTSADQVRAINPSSPDAVLNP